MIKTIKPATYFMILTLFMALIYNFTWYVRPDYFRVQAGVNFLPIELVNIARNYSAFSNSKPLPDFVPQAEEDAIKQITSIYAAAQSASLQLNQKQKELAEMTSLDREKYKLFEASMFAQMEEYVRTQQEPLAIKINKINDELHSILRNAGVEKRDQLPPGPIAVEYSQKSLEQAKLELERARVVVESHEYGLSHLTQFQQKQDQIKYIESRNNIKNLEDSVSKLQIELNKYTGEMYDAFVKYRNSTIEKLNYIDFVYFSVGAATTATFGDISPNSSLVRALVCFQVLSSITLSGIFISKLSENKS